MDEREFLWMLERYPSVRKKTHCRVQWNDMYDEASGKQEGEVGSGTFLLPGQDRVIEAADSVGDALEKVLAPCFSSQETAKIQHELEKSLEAFVARLCLEHVDDLCAQFVTTKLT
uniref:Uncharacterized protein n=1 Tax=Peronospora matthiolae TaxID=2874970 RepID=A0AAV1UPK9_9STRA